MSKIARLLKVLNVFFLGGADDLCVHIAAASTNNLRAFVVSNLSRVPNVALTETNLIFDHVRAHMPRRHGHFVPHALTVRNGRWRARVSPDVRERSAR